MFEDFKNNLLVELEIIEKIKIEKDENFRQGYLDLLNMLNRAIPELLKTTSPLKSVNSGPFNLVSVKYLSQKKNVMVLTGDKPVFDQIIRIFSKRDASANKVQAKKDAEVYSVVTPSLVKKLSNSFFRKTAEDTLPSYGNLSRNVKAANMAILPSTYLAIGYFFTFLSVFLGIGIYGVLLIIDMSSYWTYFWVMIAVPGIVFVGFLYYPKTEADSVMKNISYELPFATIHMTAIAGSDIEPTKIFQIIANSKEYVNVGREIQKILVLVQVYGYDLVTSLKNVAARTSNEKLAELLSGLASNISGGGALKDYLEKKAENFLLDYKLERRRYIDLASTFMDIYISILIAAPMVLMLMFIIMNVAGLGFQGLSMTFLMIISIIGIIIVNILFLIAINLKQPKV